MNSDDDNIIMTKSGVSFLRDPLCNTGLAASASERSKHSLTGLLPPGILSKELQLERSLLQVRSKSCALEKYIYLQTLQDTNESLYYRLLINHTAELMPIVYTPTVGLACESFSQIYRQTPRGLYISINDIGNVSSILDAWPHTDIKSIVFTDGERILGLGDLGVNGMGIPIGKLALYTACAGVNPRYCLPVTLDVGTNNANLISDPYYIGLKQPRVRGELYDNLIHEFMDSAKKKYGPSVLMQFEDFGNQNAFRLLRKYRDSHCTFNDDIQGTASVILAGLLAAAPLTSRNISQHKFVFLGAGEAGTGIADLIALAIHRESGKSLEQARRQIWLVDSKGLVVASRREKLQHHKLLYAHDDGVPQCQTLLEALEVLKPTALIGVCTIPHTFTKNVCQYMADINDTPIIFALSNPTSKAECTAREAYEWTNGTCVFASGSPFDPVTIEGKTFVPGQGNNAYIFPGVGLGVLAARMTRVTDDVMLLAAKVLASNVTTRDLENGCVYPPLSSLRRVSLEIAVAVATYGFDHKLVSNEETCRPNDIAAHVASMVYNP